MGFLGFGKRKQDLVAETSSSPCPHPIDQQQPLFEDTNDPKRITAIKCFQCGEKLPPYTHRKSAAA